MQLPRSAAARLYNSIETLQQNENFSILTKYKILKIKEVLSKEIELNQTLMIDFANKYGGINEDGSIFIKKEFAEEVSKQLNEFNNELITLPDLQIKLSELGSETKWADLEAFLPFITE